MYTMHWAFEVLEFSCIIIGRQMAKYHDICLEAVFTAMATAISFHTKILFTWCSDSAINKYAYNHYHKFDSVTQP